MNRSYRMKFAKFINLLNIINPRLKPGAIENQIYEHFIYIELTLIICL